MFTICDCESERKIRQNVAFVALNRPIFHKSLTEVTSAKRCCYNYYAVGLPVAAGAEGPP